MDMVLKVNKLKEWLKNDMYEVWLSTSLPNSDRGRYSKSFYISNLTLSTLSGLFHSFVLGRLKSSVGMK